MLQRLPSIHECFISHECLCRDRLYPLWSYDRIPIYRESAEKEHFLGVFGMSISIAIVGKDGIVLATDDRTTFVGGDIKKRRDGAGKMWTFKDRFGLMSVNMNQGSSDYIVKSLTDMLEHPEKYYVPSSYLTRIKELSNIDEFIEICSSHFNGLCKPYSFSKEQLDLGNNLSFGFTVTGYNDKGCKQIAYLHSAQSFFPMLKYDYCIGGTTFIGEHYMQKLWPYLFKFEDDVCIPLQNKDLLKKLATLIIIETSKNSEAVSDNVKMRVITNDGIETPNKDKIDQLKSECNEIAGEDKLMELLKQNKI